MSGLRGLVEKATPGPWEWVKMLPPRHRLTSLRSTTAFYKEYRGVPRSVLRQLDHMDDADARLIALAPDLALWAADAADALQNWKGQNHGFTRRGKPRRGCNLKTIHGCQPCRLLARFAVIEHTAQEDTP